MSSVLSSAPRRVEPRPPTLQKVLSGSGLRPIAPVPSRKSTLQAEATARVRPRHRPDVERCHRAEGLPPGGIVRRLDGGVDGPLPSPQPAACSCGWAQGRWAASRCLTRPSARSVVAARRGGGQSSRQSSRLGATSPQRRAATRSWVGAPLYSSPLSIATSPIAINGPLHLIAGIRPYARYHATSDRA